MRLQRAVAALALCVAASSCATDAGTADDDSGSAVAIVESRSTGETTSVDTSPVTEPAPPPTARPEELTGWVAERLEGSGGAELAAAIDADGTTVLVVGSEVGGPVTAWVERGGGFVPAEVPDTGARFTGASAIATVDGGFVAAIGVLAGGSELWRSEDGTSWTHLDESGLAADVTVSHLLAVGSGLVVGGAFPVETDDHTERTDPVLALLDPSDGALISAPELGPQGFIADIEVIDGELLAVGVRGGGAITWTSDDHGQTWQRRTPTGVLDDDRWWWPVDLAHGGGRTVLALSAVEGPLVRVADGARASWQPSGSLGVGLASVIDLDVVGGSFWLTGSRYFGRDHLARCYDDPTTGCDQTTPVVLTSGEGLTWAELDLDDPVVPRFAWRYQVVDLGDRPALATASSPFPNEPVTMLRWHGPGDPPTRPVPEDLDSDPPIVAHDAELVVGETVRYPLDTHCGVGYLGAFNGRRWYLEGRPGPGGPPEPEWLSFDEVVLGQVTLVDETTIDYTLTDGEVIGVYLATDVNPPQCM